MTDNPAFGRIHGAAGRSPAETWTAKGLQAHPGTTALGFPHVFVMAGPDTGIGHTSLVLMIEERVRFVLGALHMLARSGRGALDVRREPFAAYNDALQRKMRGTVCTTGDHASRYLDERGHKTTLWPDRTWRLWLRARRFDAQSYDVLDAPGAGIGRPATSHRPDRADPVADGPVFADPVAGGPDRTGTVPERLT